MIASIDHERDVSVYFSSEEVERVKNERLEGVLVKWHKPKQQGTIFISVDDEKSRGAGSGIQVIDKRHSWNSVGIVELFVRHDLYLVLVENGQVGVRYGTVGSKVHLYDRSRDTSHESVADHLDFYRDNKDRLHPSMG